MHHSPRLALALLLGLPVALGACTGAPAAPAWTYDPGQVAGPAVPSVPAAAAKVVEVFRSPTCTCCHEWEAYLAALGWTVRSTEVEDITQVKLERGLPEAAWSCHTAVIDGYVVEGHVPVAAIEDLLQQRPDIDGIALPGMPAGSPGMPGPREAPFAVLSVDGGELGEFGSY
jgi:hypothetical protein